MGPSLASPLTISTMTTPEEAKLIITDATAKFPAIVGAPTDDDLKRIWKFLANLIQSIDIRGGRDNLLGLIDTPEDYLAAFSHAFHRLEMPLVTYDPSISANAMQAICDKAECAWSSKRELHCMFFSAIIKETWLLPLKDASTFYNKFKIRSYLDHLSY